jgi:ribosomal protein L11 methyltransferase
LDWLEFTLLVPAAEVEAAAEVLRRHCPSGVSIEQPILPADEEEAYTIDAAQPVAVRAYLPNHTDMAQQQHSLREELNALGLASALHTRWRHEEEWAEAWKRFFGIERVSARLVVCPTWIDYAPCVGEVLIRIDPGMAFGTGQHPTTRLCLEALESRLRPGQEVLDLGTGSGILAIAAARLGAARVIAVDISAVAVEVARQNVTINGAEDRVQVLEGSLSAEGSLPDGTARCFEMIVANITSAAIIEMAPGLASALAMGGTLVAAGLSDVWAGTCRTVLENAGLRTLEATSRDGWCALICTRP